MKHATSSFGKALRTARAGKGRSQEAFDQVSSRTYISALERGIKQPTVTKVDQLAQVLGMHPLSLLALSYVKRGLPSEVEQLLKHVQRELTSLLKSPSESHTESRVGSD